MGVNLSALGPLLALAFLLQCAASQSVEKPKFLSYNKCILATASSATLTLYKKDGSPDVKEFKSPEVVEAQSSCTSNTTKESFEGSKLTLKFEKLTVSFKFTINSERRTWDFEPTDTVKVDTQEYSLAKSVKAISHSKGFSYSCQRAEIPLAVPTEYQYGTLAIKGFQIQGYTNGGKLRFDDSSDCAVWFTIPIWSSLIVVLILITILHFGISALMSISTPDRFENPKGRTLIITNFDE